MKRRVKNVEGAVTHLEEVHELGVDRVFTVSDDKNTSVGFRSNQKIHKATIQHLFRREEIQAILNVRAFWTVHAALTNPETSRVSKDRALHGELRTVCK